MGGLAEDLFCRLNIRRKDYGFVSPFLLGDTPGVHRRPQRVTQVGTFE